jgi:hypothetical protein
MHGDGLDRAGFAAAVSGIAAAVPDRHLHPGRLLELVVQGGLVRLDLDHQVPAANVDVASMGALGPRQPRPTPQRVLLA